MTAYPIVSNPLFECFHDICYIEYKQQNNLWNLQQMGSFFPDIVISRHMP